MKELLHRNGRRCGLGALALVVALGMSVGAADARKGGGGFGSRGSKTYSAPPATQTAPSTAAPMQRTQTQPGMQTGAAGAAASAAAPRRFGGFGAGLMGGLIGAGLIGMLMGGGFFSGLAGLAGMMGMLLQVALIGGLVWLAVRYFRNRSATAAAGQAGAGNFNAAPQADQRTAARTGMNAGQGPAAGATPGSALGSGFGSGAAGLAAGGAAAASRQPQYAPATTAAGTDGVGLGEQDFEAFERLLADMQSAYGRREVGVLRRICTPEAAAYLEEELAENERKGVANTSSDAKLLQGDLAEAWREGATDYASVAMRYSLMDVTREIATGRVVDGDDKAPSEVTEVWTFRRDDRGPWKLSAIQDAS